MLFYLRYSLIIFLLMLAGFVFTFLFLLRPFHKNNAYFFVRTLNPLVFKILGLKIDYRNYEQLKKSQPCIFIGNHQHNIDLFLYGLNVPKGTLSLVKRSIAYLPFFGSSYWLAGHFFINRKNHQKAMDKLIDVKRGLVEKSASIMIMPEGTRSHGKEMGPFKKGAFLMGIEIQWNIQPIVISSLGRFVDLNRWKAGTLIFQALPMVSTQGKTLSDLDALIHDTRQMMVNAKAKLDLELEQGLLA